MSGAHITREARLITVTLSTAADGLTAAIDIGDTALLGIIIPSWDAANLTFQGAESSGGTFKDVYDDLGTEVNVVAAADRFIGVDLNATPLATIRHLKIRSGTTATPVAQSTDRTLYVVTKA